jgi:hypothetical protein
MLVILLMLGAVLMLRDRTGARGSIFRLSHWFDSLVILFT